IIHRDLKPANILLHPQADTPAGKGDCPLEQRGTVSASTTPGGWEPRAQSFLSAFEPKVSDFGLAKLVKDQPASRNLTEPGQAMGTPSYMAPEQAWGKVHALAPATDVYALGAILYEMVTGRPPFEGENPTETILQVLSQE